MESYSDSPIDFNSEKLEGKMLDISDDIKNELRKGKFVKVVDGQLNTFLQPEEQKKVDLQTEIQGLKNFDDVKKLLNKLIL